MNAAVVEVMSEDPTEDLNALAVQIVDILLADMARTERGPHRTMQSLAPRERLETWDALDIMPIGSYHEVFEALGRTSVGTDGDWRNVMQQFLRCGLAFSWNSVTSGAIAQDCLYGPPRRSHIKTDFAAIETSTVNVAIHGHSPVLASVIVRLADDPEVKAAARNAGASGIRFYGICCTGLSVLYRQGGVSPLSNAMGAELVLGTGAIDAWVADVQDIYPSIMQVAACFHTTVITTSDSARLPGALHIGFDHTHSNLADVEGLARRILHVAISAFGRRRPEKVHLPKDGFDAEVGFSAENVLEAFGGAPALRDHLRSGRLRGVVNLVGCNNPKVVYEEATIIVAQHLLANDILVLTNGCASFPLLKLGFCNTEARRLSGDSSRQVLEEAGLPPVLHMGECLDNARAAGLFRAVADAAGQPLKAMPFAFASPEWSNEKGIGAALAFRLLGIDSYHCVFAATLGSDRVQNFLEHETRELLGAAAIVETDPKQLATRIVARSRAQAIGSCCSGLVIYQIAAPPLSLGEVGSLALRARGRRLIIKANPHPVLLSIALACKRDLFELPARQGVLAGRRDANRDALQTSSARINNRVQLCPAPAAGPRLNLRGLRSRWRAAPAPSRCRVPRAAPQAETHDSW